MSILSELNTLLEPLLPIETGVFSGVPPDTYMVITPLADTFALFADNLPRADINEVRLSLFCKGNYMELKNSVIRLLLGADFTITDRRYIGHEDDTGYHHFVVDIAKEYTISEGGD